MSMKQNTNESPLITQGNTAIDPFAVVGKVLAVANGDRTVLVKEVVSNYNEFQNRDNFDGQDINGGDPSVDAESITEITSAPIQIFPGSR